MRTSHSSIYIVHLIINSTLQIFKELASAVNVIYGTSRCINVGTKLERSSSEPAADYVSIRWCEMLRSNKTFQYNFQFLQSCIANILFDNFKVNCNTRICYIMWFCPNYFKSWSLFLENIKTSHCMFLRRKKFLCPRD